MINKTIRFNVMLLYLYVVSSLSKINLNSGLTLKYKAMLNLRFSYSSLLNARFSILFKP
jgi:hypothetical protein